MIYNWLSEQDIFSEEVLSKLWNAGNENINDKQLIKIWRSIRKRMLNESLRHIRSAIVFKLSFIHEK